MNLVELHVDPVRPQKEFMSHSPWTSLPLRMSVCLRGLLDNLLHKACVYFRSHYMMTFFIMFWTFCTEIYSKLWLTQTLQHDLGITPGLLTITNVRSYFDSYMLQFLLLARYFATFCRNPNTIANSVLHFAFKLALLLFSLTIIWVLLDL